MTRGLSGFSFLKPTPTTDCLKPLSFMRKAEPWNLMASGLPVNFLRESRETRPSYSKWGPFLTLWLHFSLSQSQSPLPLATIPS